MESKRNFFNQKIDILEGPKVLNKQEVTLMLSSDPESLALYQKSLRRQTISNVLSGLELGLFVGSSYLVFAPQQQSSTISNLYWPMLIGTLATGIVSGIFRRDVRNLTRESIDLFNFGNQTGPPVYFQENRIDQPFFTFNIPLSGKTLMF
jgi:hypothetical protein